MPVCERLFDNFGQKFLAKWSAKICLRAKPEFYNFSAMSLELSKIGKRQVSKWALWPGNLLLGYRSVDLSKKNFRTSEKGFGQRPLKD
jgi:hypothetical protein